MISIWKIYWVVFANILISCASPHNCPEEIKQYIITALRLE